ncbi:hypothetical protein IW261DRAFT_1571543 [Armillaria novae-zelandiae]|uniref:F-box domain-containing protein n=1 Tax=Armillaria novae-zelandiae TaxID=153914 RepID=A0AA39UAS3_9AGAR|nr:hypothetical protein IW261DRAFT_1571543 [Armillaria novae-zelandiae]
MSSRDQSTYAFLGNLLSRYDEISTYCLSPELSKVVLKASIADLDGPISEIQNEVDLLRKAAASLEMKMARLKDISCDNRAALSPIRRLCTEILAEIFHWIPMELHNSTDDCPSHYVHGFNVFKTSEGPWYLGQVCRSWRNAVQFFCPEIWSTLKIACPLNPEDITVAAPTKGMVPLLNQVLEHGRNHHLDFFFVSYLHGTEDSNEIVEPQEVTHCFDLLLKHSKRCGNVELKLDPFYVPRLSHIRGKADRLEKVHLMCIPDAMPGTMDAFKIARKLKVLSLVGMHAEADIPFPKANLSYFSDARPLPGHNTVGDCRNIIASAPDLESFSYHHYNSTIMESPGANHPQIVHQSLRVLSTSLGPLIDSLTVPGLLRVTASSRTIWSALFDCPRDTLSRIYNLVLRSECSLTVLNFDGAVMDDNLLPILRLSPRLHTLHFSWTTTPKESDVAMKSLFLDMSRTVCVGDDIHHMLLPRLEVLTLSISDVESDTVDFLNNDFVGMVASRCAICPRILNIVDINVKRRGFHMPFMDDNGSGFERLKRLEVHGLMLCLNLYDSDEYSSEESMSISDSEDG